MRRGRRRLVRDLNFFGSKEKVRKKNILLISTAVFGPEPDKLYHLCLSPASCLPILLPHTEVSLLFLTFPAAPLQIQPQSSFAKLLLWFGWM